MNRSLLIAVCDFLILSLLSLATFSVDKEEAANNAVVQEELQPVSSIQTELFDSLQESLEAEQDEAEALKKALAESEAEKKKREEALKKQTEEKAKLAATLMKEQAEKEAELKRQREAQAALEAKLVEERLRRTMDKENLEKQLTQEQAKALAEKKRLELEKMKTEKALSQAKTDLESKQQGLKSMEDKLRKEREAQLKLEKDLALAAQKKSEMQKEVARLAADQKNKNEALKRKEAQEAELKARMQERENLLLATVKSQDELRKKLEEKQNAEVVAMTEKVALEKQVLTYELESKRLKGELTNKEKEALEAKRLVAQNSQMLKNAQQQNTTLSKSLSEQQTTLNEAQVALKEAEVSRAVAKKDSEQLKEKLVETQEKVVESKVISEKIESIQSNMVEEKKELKQTLALVEESQKAFQQTIDESRVLSSHQIYKQFLDQHKVVNVSAKVESIFGARKVVKSMKSLLAKENGKTYALFHLQNYPINWYQYQGSMLELDISLTTGEKILSLEPLVVDERIVKMEINKAPSDANYIYFSSNPIQYEEVVIIDPIAGAYGRFPLRLRGDGKDTISIEASLIKQVFGTLTLKSGQYIYGSDGSLIGMMVTNKVGRLLNTVQSKSKTSIDSAVAFMKNRKSIQDWDKRSR